MDCVEVDEDHCGVVRAPGVKAINDHLEYPVVLTPM